MKKTLFAMSMAAAVNASALVTYTGSIDQGITPPDDDFAPGVVVLFGREVYVDVPANITMTAIFSEADYSNALITIGDTTYSDVIDGSSITFPVAAGLLPFGFFVTDTGESVINGGNQLAWEAGGSTPFFAVTPVETDSDGVASFYIALNDNGFGDASSLDIDLDDYVIRADVKALPVPEPGTLALLGLGAVGVGLTRIKKFSL